jgi:hypothetical protein
MGKWLSRYQYRRTQGFGPVAAFRFASRGLRALDAATRLRHGPPETGAWKTGDTFKDGVRSGTYTELPPPGSWLPAEGPGEGRRHG